MVSDQGLELLGRLIDYEDGLLDVAQTQALFAELVKSGLAWTLQGVIYGHKAAWMIRNGFLSDKGEILRTAEEGDFPWMAS